MVPNVKLHNSDPKYIKSLVKKLGMSLRDIEKEIGVSSSSLCEYMSFTRSTNCSYPVQYILESLVNKKSKKK